MIIVESENHFNTKNYLLQMNDFYKIKYLNTLIENSQIKNIELQHYPYGIANSIEIQELKTSIILKSQLKSIDYFFQNNRLNIFILNELKATAFSIIDNYENNKVIGKKLLIIIFEKFNHIRSLIREDESNDKKDIYVKLKKYFDIIIRAYDKKIVDDELNKIHQKISSNFNYLEKFQKDLNDAGYIQNINTF